MGVSATSSEDYAVAVGNSAIASGAYSLAFGKASATAASSIAFGSDAATIANGPDSVAIGTRVSTTLAAQNSLAFGIDSATSAEYSIAFGNNAEAKKAFTFAFGEFAKADSTYSLGFGKAFTTGNQYNFAFGSDSTSADGEFSFAFGDGTSTTATTSSLAFGGGVSVTGSFTAAFGLLNSATSSFSFVAGAQNQASGDYSAVFGQNAAADLYGLAVGSGTSAGQYCLAFGESSKATSDHSMAGGLKAVTSGSSTLVFGENINVLADRSAAFGSSLSITTGELHFMAGSGLTITSPDHAVAFGQGSSISVPGFVAGKNAQVKGEWSTAFGVGTETGAYAEFVAGMCNTLDAAAESIYANPVNSANRLMTLGNGLDNGATGCTSRSDAFIVYKSGQAWSYGWNTFSDIRKKKDVTDFDGLLERIQQMRAVSFFWKEPQIFGERAKVGMIAQEVREVFPEIVEQNSHGDLSISYDSVAAIAVQGVKEVYDEVTHLRREVETLKQTVALLIAQLNRVQTKV